MEPILQVKDLHVSFKVKGGEVKAVRGVNFEVNKGETVAIVGESGSGKSVTAQTIMQLIPSPPSKIDRGEIIFQGNNLLKFNSKKMEKIRGKDIGMIFQDPMTSLNPTIKVGRQITEVLIKHQKMTAGEAKKQGIEMLKLVGIKNAESRFNQYPHEFSGGMRQRVMIAIALACRPALLIADEPTTALDVTIQAQIMDVMKDMQMRLGTSIILITHDLGVVAGIADRVVVMYAGEIVESGTKMEIFKNPQHPYTKGLLRSMPRLDQKKNEPLIPIIGTPPDLIKPPIGCPFAARCNEAMSICDRIDPDATHFSDSHWARCWDLHPMAKEAKHS